MIASRAGATVIRTGDQPLGPARARNLAASRSEADILVFVDSDVVVAPEAIEQLVEPLTKRSSDSQPSVSASFGSYDDCPASDRVTAVYANLRHHLTHQQANGEASTFWAGLGAVRREAFNSVGGFSTAYDRPSIEDIELGMRLRRAGHRIRLIHAAQGKHLKDWTLRELWRTDIFARAIPWAHLMLSGDGLIGDLNGSMAQRASAICVAGVAACFAAAIALFSLIPLGFAFGLVIVWVTLNWPLLRLIHRRGGWSASIPGDFLHAAYHGYAAACLAYVWLTLRWEKPPRPGDQTNRLDDETDELDVKADPPHHSGGSGLTSRIARSGLIAVIMLICFAAAFALAIRFTPTEHVNAGVNWLRDRPPASLTVTNVQRAQQRFGVVAISLLAGATLLIAIGPVSVTRLLNDLVLAIGQTISRARSTAWTITLPVVVSMAALTLGACRHNDQPMRADETTTYIDYARRSLPEVLLRRDNTNNHVPHTAMVWASTRLLGDSPWAIRLPVAITMVLCVPAIAWTATRWFGPTTGLFAASLLGGAGYSIDLATNARGYPLVILSFTLMLGLLPSVRNGRPAAVAVFTLLASLAAWAVPVAIYPFAICLVWLVLGEWILPRPKRPRGDRIIAWGMMIMATGILVAAGHLSAHLLTASNSTTSLGSVVGRLAARSALWRIEETARNLTASFQLFSYPLDRWFWVLVILMAIGLLRWIIARRVDVVVMVASVPVAMTCIWLMIRMVSPPWWSLNFLYPMGCVGVASAIAWPFGATRNASAFRRRFAASLASVFATVVLAVVMYPVRFPGTIEYYAGLPEGERAAEQIIQHYSTFDAPVVARGSASDTIEYYLGRLGSARRVFPSMRQADHPERAIVVIAKHWLKTDGAWTKPRDPITDRYRMVDRQEFIGFDLATVHRNDDSD